MQLKTEATCFSFHRGRERPDQFDLLFLLLKTEGGLKALPGEADPLLRDSRLNPQQAEVRERRHAAQLSFLKQRPGALLVALGHQAIEPRMLSVPGLDDDLSCFVCAAGPASDLHDCLDHLFLAPKVGAEQANVGIQNSHQRDIREMVTLGEHLCAQQDTGLPLIDFVRQLREGLTTPRRVAVNSEHRD